MLKITLLLLMTTVVLAWAYPGAEGQNQAFGLIDESALESLEPAESANPQWNRGRGGGRGGGGGGGRWNGGGGGGRWRGGGGGGGGRRWG